MKTSMDKTLRVIIKAYKSNQTVAKFHSQSIHNYMVINILDLNYHPTLNFYKLLQLPKFLNLSGPPACHLYG